VYCNQRSRTKAHLQQYRSDYIVSTESCHFKDAAQLEIKQLKAEVKETASTPKWG